MCVCVCVCVLSHALQALNLCTFSFSQCFFSELDQVHVNSQAAHESIQHMTVCVFPSLCLPPSICVSSVIILLLAAEGPFGLQGSNEPDTN